VLAAAAAIATVIATTPLFLHHVDASNFQGADFAQALQPSRQSRGGTKALALRGFKNTKQGRQKFSLTETVYVLNARSPRGIANPFPYITK
jgi:hypothetical protein